MKTAILILAVVSAVLCAPPGVGQHGAPSVGNQAEVGDSPEMHTMIVHDGNEGPAIAPAVAHHRPLPPPYLGNVSDEARQEYFNISSNMNTSIAQQKQNILAWAQKNGVEAQVQEFNNNMTTLITQMKQNVTTLINSLPSALQQFLSVAGNETQTPMEMKEAMHSLMAQSPEVYHIIKLAMGSIHPHGAGFAHGPRKFHAMKEPKVEEEEGEFHTMDMPEEDNNEEDL
ncbi:hypothetical protein COOONC_09132 [Cooperia oncophora]